MTQKPPISLDDALDALEAMCEQYLWRYSETQRYSEFTHAFMSAGEYACEVLTRARPERWTLTKWGMARND